MLPRARVFAWPCAVRAPRHVGQPLNPLPLTPRHLRYQDFVQRCALSRGGGVKGRGAAAANRGAVALGWEDVVARLVR